MCAVKQSSEKGGSEAMEALEEKINDASNETLGGDAVKEAAEKPNATTEFELVRRTATKLGCECIK